VKLTLKLALFLSAVLGSCLAVALGVVLRSDARILDARIDHDVRSALGRLAARCGLPADAAARARCEEAVALTRELTYPEAFSQAVLIDAKSRVLVEADARGAVSNDAVPSFAADRYLTIVSLAETRNPVRRFPLGTEPVDAYVEPLLSAPGRAGSWILAYRSSALDAARAPQRHARRRLIEAGVLSASAAVVAAALLAFFILAPLEPIFEAARRVAKGDLAYRIPEGRSDELGMLAAEFNRMTRGLAELDEMKEGFMAQITHDLSSPLSAMLGHVQLVAGGYKGAVNDEQKESLTIVVRNAQALGELIDNILEVTRLESGKFEFQPSTLELAPKVRAVLQLLQVRADEYGVRLESALLPELTYVQVDEQAFRRLLTNLVSNALKFTPAGGAVTVKAYRGKPGEVVVAVADTGVGIPKDRLSSMFGKFFQVPETKDKVRPGRGTGLGLVICKRIVEAHGGRLWVDSRYGSGTTFAFTLPEPARPS